MIYFLSDAHLGSRVINDPSAHQKKLVMLLEKMSKDATSIFLLGDIFDFWFEYFWSDKSKKEYILLLNTLKKITQSGISVHFFIGNHDLWTFGWLARQTGIQVHRQPQSMLLNNKRVYLAHGDGLIPKTFFHTLPPAIKKKINHFILLRKIFHHPIPQFLFRLIPPTLGNHFGYEWAKRSRLKEIAHPCAYKGEGNEELVLYAKEKEQEGDHHDYYIFGHRHIELDLMLPSKSRVVLLGDCWRQWTYAQLDEQGHCLLNTFENE